MTTDRWAVFETCRPRLLRIAFRMTRSSEDAEDLIQETALRWLRADTAAVRTPIAWLIAVITRLAIDGLRRAARSSSVSSRANASHWCCARRSTAITGRSPACSRRTRCHVARSSRARAGAYAQRS